MGSGESSIVLGECFSRLLRLLIFSIRVTCGEAYTEPSPERFQQWGFMFAQGGLTL